MLIIHDLSALSGSHGLRDNGLCRLDYGQIMYYDKIDLHNLGLLLSMMSYVYGHILDLPGLVIVVRSFVLFLL
jgi:hypothetical protein